MPRARDSKSCGSLQRLCSRLAPGLQLATSRNSPSENMCQPNSVQRAWKTQCKASSHHVAHPSHAAFAEHRNACHLRQAASVVCGACWTTCVAYKVGLVSQLSAHLECSEPHQHCGSGTSFAHGLAHVMSSCLLHLRRISRKPVGSSRATHAELVRDRRGSAFFG